VLNGGGGIIGEVKEAGETQDAGVLGAEVKLGRGEIESGGFKERGDREGRCSGDSTDAGCVRRSTGGGYGDGDVEESVAGGSGSEVLGWRWRAVAGNGEGTTAWWTSRRERSRDSNGSEIDRGDGAGLR
jgi:hypothetical protein